MATIHKTKTQWNGGMQFTGNIDGHTFIMDTTAAGGGTNSGPSPKPFLLTALGGCTGMDIVPMLHKMRVAFSDFSIDVDAALSDEHPRVYTEININYYIKMAEADHDKMEKAVAMSKDKYCGVSAMLEKICPINFKINYL